MLREKVSSKWRHVLKNSRSELVQSMRDEMPLSVSLSGAPFRELPSTNSARNDTLGKAYSGTKTGLISIKCPYFIDLVHGRIFSWSSVVWRSGCSGQDDVCVVSLSADYRSF